MLTHLIVVFAQFLASFAQRFPGDGDHGSFPDNTPPNAPIQSTPILDVLPRVFTGESYSGSERNISLDGKCQVLSGELYTNVGSIYIPCEAQAPKGKKNVCTLYGGSSCDSALVKFDHSHYKLFDNGGAFEASYVGGQVTAVKCEVVDTSTPISNTNRHVSTQHQSKCIGDTCSSQRDCPKNGIPLYCSKSKTCQSAGYINEGYNCREDYQCKQGYCRGSGLANPGWAECRPKRGWTDTCASTAECDASLKCCVPAHGGGQRCIPQDAPCKSPPPRSCTASGRPCFSNSACCSKKCNSTQFFFLFQCD